MKKSVLAVSLMACLMALMAITTPALLQNTKIGLEFKGGYEVLYTAQSHTPGQPVDKNTLLKTAELLSSRANGLGIAEPDVIIEGDRLIRVKLAGVSSNEQVRAILTQGGQLPVKLTETYSQTVGGVLGEADLRDTLRAGAIALTLILGFMALVYRIPGLITAFCLLTYLWLLLITFNLLHATLSLAAIVAFVLGIGIASDANILSFERIQEELHSGKPLGAAVKDGAHHALRAILDSNATGLISAIVLFTAGIGPIRGFALTTMLSIVISLISNVLLAQLLLKWVSQSAIARGRLFFSPHSEVTQAQPQIQPHSLGISKIDFVKIRLLPFLLSGLFALVGAYTLATSPLNLDIDFKAGTALDIAISQPIDQEKAIGLMEDAGISPATVAIGGPQSNQIAARFDNVLNGTEVNQIVDRFKKDYGSSVAYQENTADPIVANQLATQAIYAIAFASLGIFAFVWIRFDWKFAIAAILGILNSAFFVLSTFAIFKYEIDVTFIAAILTVIGYSVNDTIVIFDRIRENIEQVGAQSVIILSTLVNQSIWQMLRRSIYTVLTVVTGALCLFYWGAEPLHAFALAIFFGLLCGAYSSIFIAAQVWLLLQGRWRKSLPSTNLAG
jgi:preprotein translocase SecF subunit